MSVHFVRTPDGNTWAHNLSEIPAAAFERELLERSVRRHAAEIVRLDAQLERMKRKQHHRINELARLERLTAGGTQL